MKHISIHPLTRILAVRHLRLAVPISLQILLRFLIQFVDNIVVGQLGETAIAGVAISNQLFFIYILFLFGIGSGSSTILSQFWGQKALPGIRSTLGFAGMISCTVSILFCIVVGIFATNILSLYSTEKAVIDTGTEYLRIVLFSYPFQSLSFVLITGFRSIERANSMFPVALGAVILNIFLDIVMVFGFLGFPPMGVKGSALATVITMILQLIVILCILFASKNPIRGPVSDFFQWSVRQVKQFFRVVSPVVINEVVWSLGTTMYFIVFGRIGTGAITAFNIASLLFRFVLVGCIGSGQATTVLVGKMIGAQKMKTLAKYIKKLLPASVIVAIVSTGLLCSFAWVIPNAFNILDTTKHLLTLSILALTPLFVLRIINMHILIGVLRGGADTIFAMYSETIAIWALGVPCAFIFGWVLQWHPALVMLTLAIEEISKLFIGLYRLRTDAWIKRVHAD